MNAIDHDSTATITVSTPFQTPTQRRQLRTAMNSNMIGQHVNKFLRLGYQLH